MAQTLTNFDAVLKEFYEGSIRETVNNEVVAFKMLDESDKEWSGRHVRFPVHTSRNSGVGARAESGTLPTAGQQGYLEARVTSTYQYGRIEISGPSMKAGKNAFAATVASEIDGMTRDLVNDLGRQTWGTGDGRLAQIGAAAASASSFTVFNRFFEPGQPGARYINVGASVDIGTVASPTALASSQVVASVSISSNPATTTDTVNITASTANASQCESFVFNRGAGGAGVEMHGFRSLIDVFTEANIWGSNAFFGSAVQNINRATNAAWNATILGNSGVARVIDGNLIQQAFDQINIDAGKDPDFLWGHHAVCRAFLDAVSADRRYGSPEFKAGYSELSYNGVPLVRDRQAPHNELLIGVKGTVSMFTLADFEWADEDGSILARVSNQDQFEAFIRAYKNLGLNENPKGCVFIRDIRTDL